MSHVIIQFAQIHVLLLTRWFQIRPLAYSCILMIREHTVKHSTAPLLHPIYGPDCQRLTSLPPQTLRQSITTPHTDTVTHSTSTVTVTVSVTHTVSRSEFDFERAEFRFRAVRLTHSEEHSHTRDSLIVGVCDIPSLAGP